MRCVRCHSMLQHSKYHDRRQHILLEGRMPQRKKLNFEGQCFVGTARGHNKVFRAATFTSNNCGHMPRHATAYHAHNFELYTSSVALTVRHCTWFYYIWVLTLTFLGPAWNCTVRPPSWSFRNEIELAGVALQSRLLPPRITALRCKGAAMHFVPGNLFSWNIILRTYPCM